MQNAAARRMNKNKVFLLLALTLLCSPGMLFGACQEILAKLPDHSNDNTPYRMQVAQFEQECRNRPNADDPKVVKQCMSAGLSSMVIYGNYIAAEMLAKMYCEEGFLDLSKQMMRSVAANPYTPPEDKAVAELMQQEE